MNEKEKENVKEAEEEEEEDEGIWVREQRKRKRKRSRRRRRRQEQLADRLDLAPASDRGQRQWQRAEVRGQTSVIFFFFSLLACRSRVRAVSKPCRRHVGEAKKKKKKKETLAGHRNQVSHTSTGVRHVSDTDTMPKMACPCNLAPSRSHQHFPLMQKKECTNSIPFLFSPNLLFII